MPAGLAQGATGCQRLVAYYRVSTRRQGASGLGLEGQKAAIEHSARLRGAEVVASYTEVESGSRADRPELARAVAHAARSKATLVVAKLDRLARNVAFLSTLMESGAEFQACDNPHANRLTIHILAAVAEDEARRISERTKAALQAYKARGGKLGASLQQCRSLSPEARLKGARQAAKTRSEDAARAYRDISPDIVSWRDQGLSLREIAGRLNVEGHTTRRGFAWNPVQVSRVLTRESPRLAGARAPHAP